MLLKEPDQIVQVHTDFPEVMVKRFENCPILLREKRKNVSANNSLKWLVVTEKRRHIGENFN